MQRFVPDELHCEVFKKASAKYCRSKKRFFTYPSAVVLSEVFIADGKHNRNERNGNEVGKDKATGKVVVSVNPKFFRPAEVELLIGNPAKAEEKLGWKREISFQELVERMVKNDLALVEKEIKVSKL